MIVSLKSEKVDSQIRLINTILRRDGKFINSRFCFFLGAGCSISSGIPLASQLILILKKLIFIDYHSSINSIVRQPSELIYQYIDRIDSYILKYEIDFEEFVTFTEESFLKQLKRDKQRFNRYISDARNKSNLKILKNLFLQDSLYGLWFEKYSKTPRKRQALVEEIIENTEPSVSYILLSQLIRNGYIRNIFTTNFDDLISYSLLLYYSEKPKVYFHNEIAKYINFEGTKPNIIKLHGDFLYESVKNINSETEYLDPNMEKKFLEGLNNRDIVFLGYNGADESIMNTILKVRTENKFTIFWCGIDEQKLHWRVIKLLNETNDSYFIKIRSFDDFIFELYNQIPEKNEINIVQKAKMTEIEIKNYLDSFNKKRLKRSHKICSEEYSPTKVISEGQELLGKIDANSLTIDTTIKYYRIINELNPNTDWIINNYGVSLLKDNNHSEALDIISEGLMYHKNFPLLWYNIGIVYHDTDRLEDARIAFMKATELHPSFANAFNNLAATYNSQREYKLALSAIEKAIHISRNGKFLVLKGIILKNQKEITEAIKLYDEAIEKQEDLLEAFLNKSNALRLIKSYDLAEEFSLKALLINSEHEYIYATLSQIFAEKGDKNNFYYYLIEALKRNYPIWRHLDDRAFINYKKEERFTDLLKEYCPINM
ncbi:MAG: SIR2 family protein [Ignavibacteria bacterium]